MCPDSFVFIPTLYNSFTYLLPDFEAHISQGSVVIHSSCGGVFTNECAANYCEFPAGWVMKLHAE